MLSREDRIKVAQVTGTVQRLLMNHAEDGMGEALMGDVDAGRGEFLDRARAILHAISDDPQILCEASAMFTTPPSTPVRLYSLRLLVLLGADEAEARRIQAARGRGWRTPQAKAYGETDS